METNSSPATETALVPGARLLLVTPRTSSYCYEGPFLNEVIVTRVTKARIFVRPAAGFGGPVIPDGTEREFNRVDGSERGFEKTRVYSSAPYLALDPAKAAELLARAEADRARRALEAEAAGALNVLREVFGRAVGGRSAEEIRELAAFASRFAPPKAE